MFAVLEYLIDSLTRSLTRSPAHPLTPTFGAVESNRIEITSKSICSLTLDSLALTLFIHIHNTYTRIHQSSYPQSIHQFIHSFFLNKFRNCAKYLVFLMNHFCVHNPNNSAPFAIADQAAISGTIYKSFSTLYLTLLYSLPYAHFSHLYLYVPIYTNYVCANHTSLSQTLKYLRVSGMGFPCLSIILTNLYGVLWLYRCSCQGTLRLRCICEDVCFLLSLSFLSILSREQLRVYRSAPHFLPSPKHIE